MRDISEILNEIEMYQGTNVDRILMEQIMRRERLRGILVGPNLGDPQFGRVRAEQDKKQETKTIEVKKCPSCGGKVISIGRESACFGCNYDTLKEIRK